jgi:hypothetical protein
LGKEAMGGATKQRREKVVFQLIGSGNGMEANDMVQGALKR